MKLAVMDPANRDGELVAHSVSKRTRLGKREVMRIRRHAATHKTRLPQYEFPVVLIAQADRFAQSADHPTARSLLGRRRAEAREDFPLPRAGRSATPACPSGWLRGSDRGSSTAGLETASRSGASRSSSPAIPTSVNSA